MKALYPFVGGTASTHKYNFMDARDLDIAFRLQFNGGWTHSSTGALPNGTNAYANTYFRSDINQSLTSGHFALYSRTSTASTAQYAGHGVRDSAPTEGIGIQHVLRRSDNLSYCLMWDETSSGYTPVVASSNASGFYIGSRNASNSLKLYKNNSIIGQNTNNQVITTLSQYNIYLSAVNQNGAASSATCDNKELALSSIGAGLSDTDASTFYTLTQAMQVSLSRAV
jgi:hypothetical protein